MSMRARIVTGAVVATAAALLSPTPVGALAPAAGAADTIDVTGTVLVLPGEDGGSDRYSLRLPSGRILELADGFSAEPLSHFAGSVSVPGTTSGRSLTGARRSSTLRRVSDAGTPLEVVSSRLTPSAPAPGPAHHTTYVARVTNFGPIGLTDAQILDGVAASQQWWVQQSGGWIPSWTTAAGVVPVASGAGSSARGCGLGLGGADFGAIVDSVGAQAFPGVDFSGASAHHLVVVVPDGCGGSTSGRGRLGTSLANGGPVILQAEAGVEFRVVLEHEYGHNVGLEHANNAGAEYGNLYEVMGAGPPEKLNPALGTVYRFEQGILATGEVVDGVAGGSWALQPRSATTGLRGVHFINPDDGRRYFVDYRDGAGADAGTCYATPDYCNYATLSYGQDYRPGIVVAREDGDAGSFLLPVPGNDGALQGGETWSNASGSLQVVGTGATVQVVPGSYPNGTFAGGTANMTAPVALREVTASGAEFAPAPAVYRYQWLLDGAPITGAESATFRPTLTMVGGSLSVVVTAYGVGYRPVSRQSVALVVAPAAWSANGARRYPEITGSRRVGGTLTAHGLDWVNDDNQKPTDFSATYQWLRNGTQIPGATATTYRLTAKDLGTRIQVSESPRAAGYATVFATSSTTGAISKGRLVSPRPRIGGRARVGRKVVARATGWTKGTKFRYRWFVNGRAVRGAHSRKLLVTGSMRKGRIVVKVTGTKKAYRTASAKSRATKVR